MITMTEQEYAELAAKMPPERKPNDSRPKPPAIPKEEAQAEMRDHGLSKHDWSPSARCPRCWCKATFGIDDPQIAEAYK